MIWAEYPDGWSQCKRAGLIDEADTIERFYTGTIEVAKTLPGRLPHFARPQVEWQWHQHGRHYAHVHPAIAEQLMRFPLRIDAGAVAPSPIPMAILLPVDSPLSYGGWRISSVLCAAVNTEAGPGLAMLIDSGGKDRVINNTAGAPIDAEEVYYFCMPLIAGLSLDDSAREVERLNPQLEAVVRLACGLTVILRDTEADMDLWRVDVLARDLPRYLICTDPDLRQSIERRAGQRGKRGVIVGERFNTDERLVLRWTGEGRTVPRLVRRRKNEQTEIPQSATTNAPSEILLRQLRSFLAQWN